MSNGTIRELYDVRHVPELKRNLISLSILDKRGRNIKVESSVLKVIRGSTVLMKSYMSDGLNVLYGTTKTSDVNVAMNHIKHCCSI